MKLNVKQMRANAERIVALADAFGHLPYNDHGQQVEATLNLSIPCARLVKAGIVLAVEDTADGVNDSAVADVERSCALAVLYVARNGSDPFEWKTQAQTLGLDLAAAEEDVVLNALYWAGRSTGVASPAEPTPLHLHEIENKLRHIGLNDAERIAPVLDRLVADGRVVEGKSTFGAVWALGQLRSNG